MRSHELTTGRTFGIAFDHDDDFFDPLTAFCTANNVRQGYIPMFIAGFAEAEIVGTCEKIADPAAPIWSTVHLTNVEALGCGTLAATPKPTACCPTSTPASVSKNTQPSATPIISSPPEYIPRRDATRRGHHPAMLRSREPALYDVPLLRFSS
ncbi:MAG: hypothetical protein ACRDRS_10825 [Pseudonocardiaceae bacterium]